MSDLKVDAFQALKGKKIFKVAKLASGEALWFETDAGPLCYLTEGECCNTFYFHNIEGVEDLIGQVVTEVTDHEMDGFGNSKKDSDNDWTSVHFITILCPKGRLTIDFRQDSNGCYEGTAHLLSGENTVAYFIKTSSWIVLGEVGTSPTPTCQGATS